jgi:hypothetical protein
LALKTQIISQLLSRTQGFLTQRGREKKDAIPDEKTLALELRPGYPYGYGGVGRLSPCRKIKGARLIGAANGFE